FGRGDDRRDHAARAGAADRRTEGKAARCASRRHPHGAHPGRQHQGSRGDSAEHQREPRDQAGEVDRRGVAGGATPHAGDDPGRFRRVAQQRQAAYTQGREARQQAGQSALKSSGWRPTSLSALRCFCYNARPNKKDADMNKAELIEAVSTQTSLQKADATRAVDAVFDSITSALKSGDTVALLGFGTFVVKARAARAGRNPRTNETIQIPASKVPGFKAGKALKDAVN